MNPLSVDPLPSTLRVVPPPADGPADDPLIQGLLESLRERWERGERPLAEEYFNEHPELWQDVERALDVIYEEICLRQKFGLVATERTIMRRFPQWHDQLEILFQCHHLLEPLQAPSFPGPGDRLGDFLLLGELGKGACGKVYLAAQSSLGDRQVVLKVTPQDAREHLSLARLQHTHIMPVYATYLIPERRLRLLCLPYFGGATLAKILETLAKVPLRARTGRDVATALQDLSGPSAPRPDAAITRSLFEPLTYVHAICILGACLADALHYAHQRRLMHFDVKPSNVLLAADGQPLLLDFHLAREPLRPGMIVDDEMGGTPAYMPPEQRAAMLAVEKGAPVPCAVDERADIYGLAAVLYEALGGTSAFQPGFSPPLVEINSQVTIGLSDLIAKGLERDPARRQVSAAALADDLRRHVQDLPLLTVPNRSWRERWRKWRRRRPGVFRLALLFGAVLLSTFALSLLAWLHWSHRVDEAGEALDQARQQWRERGLHDEARATLQRGLDHVQGLVFASDLVAELSQELTRLDESQRDAQRQQLRHELHSVADQMRSSFGSEMSAETRTKLYDQCQRVWVKRNEVLAPGGNGLEARAIDDLLDLALLQIEWRTEEEEAARLLAEAEAFAGPRAVLSEQRRRLGLDVQGPPPVPRSPWEHYALGRSAWRVGDLAAAQEHLNQALLLEPHHRWANFLLGQCAFRLERYHDAVAAFSLCIGAAPELAAGYYNRAVAYAALKRWDRALADCNSAVRLQPRLAAAWFQRGLVHLHEKRLTAAVSDLEQALALGHAKAPVHVQLARAALAGGDRASARQHVATALKLDPKNTDAREVHEQVLRAP